MPINFRLVSGLRPWAYWAKTRAEFLRASVVPGIPVECFAPGIGVLDLLKSIGHSEILVCPACRVATLRRRRSGPADFGSGVHGQRCDGAYRGVAQDDGSIAQTDHDGLEELARTRNNRAC